VLCRPHAGSHTRLEIAGPSGTAPAPTPLALALMGQLSPVSEMSFAERQELRAQLVLLD